MQLRSASLRLVFSLSWLAWTAHAGEPANANVKPLYGTAGDSVLQVDFASAQLSDAWHIVKGKWAVKDGALHGVQIPEENHAAVLRRELALHDFIAHFTFKFDGGKAVKLVINKQTLHIATVSIWQNSLTIDKQSRESSGLKLRRLDERKINLQTEDWHAVSVAAIGDMLVVVLDGNLLAFGSDAGLDTDKTDIDFAANGAVSIKSMSFHRAQAPADKEAALRKLSALRKTN